MRQDHFDMLVEVMKSPEFAGMALGNAKLAKSMRSICSGVVGEIEKEFGAE
jgi:hypothetical protein